YHKPSHELHCFLLVLLGRREEAREATARVNALFPEDINSRTMAAMVEASDGNSKKELAIIKEIERRVSQRDYRLMAASVQFLAALSRLDDPPDPIERARLVLLWASVVPDFTSLFPWMGERKAEIADAPGLFLVVPPVIGKSL